MITVVGMCVLRPTVVTDRIIVVLLKSISSGDFLHLLEEFIAKSVVMWFTCR